MNQLFYPAIFHTAEEGGYWVTFPDFPCCMTQGDDISEAYEMAVDALGLELSERIENKMELPVASKPKAILVEDGVLIVVEFDYSAYQKRTSSKSIKKTLTIPEWLNEAAEKENINFSQLLQKALKEQLHLNA